MPGKNATTEWKREYYAKWRKENPDKVKGAQLKTKYGISMPVYEAMLKAQDGKCAICKEPFSQTPHVDHCHSTGVVRGLLCGLCNKGLGHFADSPERLIAAAHYLNTYH